MTDPRFKFDQEMSTRDIEDRLTLPLVRGTNERTAPKRLGVAVKTPIRQETVLSVVGRPSEVRAQHENINNTYGVTQHLTKGP